MRREMLDILKEIRASSHVSSAFTPVFAPVARRALPLRETLRSPQPTNGDEGMQTSSSHVSEDIPVAGINASTDAVVDSAVPRILLSPLPDATLRQYEQPPEQALQNELYNCEWAGFPMDYS